MQSFVPRGQRQTKAKVSYWYNYFKSAFGAFWDEVNNIDLLDSKHLLCPQNPHGRGGVVYAIIIDLNTLYIGRSIDLGQRLKQHHDDWLGQLNCNYKVHYCSISKDLDIDIVERFFIQKYKSNLNGLSAQNKIQMCNNCKN